MLALRLRSRCRDDLGPREHAVSEMVQLRLKIMEATMLRVNQSKGNRVGWLSLY